MPKERFATLSQAWIPEENEPLELAQLQMTTDNSCRFLEEGDRPLENRITVTCLIKSGKFLIEPASGLKLQDGLSKNCPLDPAENEALFNLQEQIGWEYFVGFWISPPEPPTYPEARLNFYVTYTGKHLQAILPQIERILVQEKKEAALQRINEAGSVILLYAIPAKYTVQECTDLALRLACFFGISDTNLEKVETLRKNPLRLAIPTSHWIDILKHLIEIPWAWKKIEDGSVFVNREKANAVAYKMTQKFLPLIIAAGNNLFQQQLIEKQMRIAAEVLGYKIVSQNSSCPTTAFNYMDNLARRLILFGSNSGKFTEQGICRMCNRIKLVCPPPAGCYVCQDCEEEDNRKKAV